MTAREIAVIRVGERDREPGDVTDLMASMTDVGLLHPIVVTPDDHLVAGGRRLEAAKQLGWSEIDVTVIRSLADAELTLKAEQDENTCRRDLTLVEAERARARRAKVLAPVAERAKAQAPGKPRGAKDSPAKLAGETRKVAAQGTGYSGTTLDKVAEVREVAEDKARPEPVRAVARKALAAMDKPQAKADPHHKAVRDADAYTRAVAEFPELEHYADQPTKAVALATELRTYSGRQREKRRDILRRNIALDRNRGDAEATPDYEHLAHLMFLAANQAGQVITDKGGADTFAHAIAMTDPLLAATWVTEFEALASVARQIADTCRPRIRRVK